jgi:hypothetical protein
VTTALLIVSVVVVVQLAVWVPLLVIWRRRAAASIQDLEAQIRASGEKVLAGPEQAVYRGGTGGYSRVKGNGTIILTDRRLLFRKLAGGGVEVARPRIAGVSRSRRGGNMHLVVTTTDPGEVAFVVKDLDAWERALR